MHGDVIQNGNNKKKLEMYELYIINVTGQENSMEQGNISKIENNKHENKQKKSDASSTGSCQSLFTVTSPKKTSEYFGAALEAIQELGANVARGVAGLTDPYTKLADQPVWWVIYVKFFLVQ